MRPVAVAALVLLAACGSSGGSSSSGSSGSGSSSGSSSGSTSGSGSSSGSSGTTGALTDTFDVGRVYFVGTFDEQYCGSDAVAAPEDPGQNLVGLPCFDASFRMRPDGKLLYLVSDQSGTNSLHVFTADALRAVDGGWAYPADPASNDPVVPTPACDALGGPTAFLIDPSDGGAIFNCGSSNDWWDAAGTVRVANASPHALGPQGSALVFASGQLAVRDGAGNDHPLSLGFTSIDTVRSAPDGFWLALEDNGARNLWHLDVLGGAADAGRYAPLDGASPVSALDGSGNLFIFAADPRDAGASAIFELPRDGSAPVQLYGELDAPPLDWSSTPPVLYPRIGTQGGRIFSGP